MCTDGSLLSSKACLQGDQTQICFFKSHGRLCFLKLTTLSPPHMIFSQCNQLDLLPSRGGVCLCSLPLEPGQICDYSRNDVLWLPRLNHKEMKHSACQFLRHISLDNECDQLKGPEAGVQTNPHTETSWRGSETTWREKSSPHHRHTPPHLPCAQGSSSSTNWLPPQKWSEPEPPSQATLNFLTQINHEIILSHKTGVGGCHILAPGSEMLL